MVMDTRDTGLHEAVPSASCAREGEDVGSSSCAFASKNEFAGAAVAQAEANELKTHEEQLTAKKKTVDELAAKRDFVGAAAAQAEVTEL